MDAITSSSGAVETAKAATADAGAALAIAPKSTITVPPRPSRSRSRKKLLLGAAGLLLAAAAMVVVKMRMRSADIVFETAKIEQGTVQATVTATGNLNPVVNVQVGSQVSGNIKALYADFNTRVTKGQLIAEIDPEIFQAQMDAAEAVVHQQEAALASAEAQHSKARAEAAAAVANRNGAIAGAAKDRATMINLEREWNRTSQLFQQGVVSTQDRDAAKAAYDAIVAQLLADSAQIDSSDRAVSSADAQVAAAKAQLEVVHGQLMQAQAALGQAKINLAHTRIIAPVSGTVIARHFDVGQTVAASFQAPDIFDIGEDLAKMQVDTNVDEADVGSVAVGQQAKFTVDAYPGREFNGRVMDIRKAPINAQNVITYDVVISAANDDLKLFPGMTAKVTIYTNRADGALKTPNAALRYRPDSNVLAKYKNVVKVSADTPHLYIKAGPQIEAVAVTTGITDGRFTVVSGAKLHAGQDVVVRVQQDTSQASPGAPTSTRMPGTR